jgi:hypothetical protein
MAVYDGEFRKFQQDGYIMVRELLSQQETELLLRKAKGENAVRRPRYLDSSTSRH